jgi:hypothetical protein
MTRAGAIDDPYRGYNGLPGMRSDNGGGVVEYAGVPIRVAAVHDQPAPSVSDGRVDDDNPPGRVETWFETHPRMTAALTVFLFGVIPYGTLVVMDIMHGAGQ